MVRDAQLLMFNFHTTKFSNNSIEIILQECYYCKYSYSKYECISY